MKLNIETYRRNCVSVGIKNFSVEEDEQDFITIRIVQGNYYTKPQVLEILDEVSRLLNETITVKDYNKKFKLEFVPIYSHISTDFIYATIQRFSTE